jgi:hypothetical protein
MSSGSRANPHQIAVGLCILLLGVFLVLDRLDIVPASQTLRYWPIGLIILGLSVIIQAARGDAGQVRSSVPWGAIFLLLIAGFVGSRIFERQKAAPETAESTTIFAVLGGDRRSAGPNFRSASITAVMGGAQLDLRTAEPGPGQDITVDVFNVMGGSVIYAPTDWIVDVRAIAVMGGINDQRRGRPERRGRGGRDEGIDVDFPPLPSPPPPPVPPGSPDGPTPPIAPIPPVAPGSPIPPTPPTPPQDADAIDVEAEIPPAAPPRLIIRGFVGMGGLVIKSL